MRDVEFVTAMDVFLWVSRNMPAGDPGSLETQEYVDILAFAIAANGVELEGPLSAENAAAVVLNPWRRAKCVPRNRQSRGGVSTSLRVSRARFGKFRRGDG